jgi:hypothetical protein
VSWGDNFPFTAGEQRLKYRKKGVAVFFGLYLDRPLGINHGHNSKRPRKLPPFINAGMASKARRKTRYAHHKTDFSIKTNSSSTYH